MHTIESTIEIPTPAHRIVEALTTQAGYRSWFTEATTFDGTHVTFTFAMPAITRVVTFRVDQRDARGIAMTCTSEQNNREWLGTQLAISVEDNRVRLVHAGFAEKNEYYDQCVKGWAYFLGSLKSYLETGVGTPLAAGTRI